MKIRVPLLSRSKPQSRLASRGALHRRPRSLHVEGLESRRLLAFNTPIIDVRGMDPNVLPPDTTGDVGPNHYVQMTNSEFAGALYQVYDKDGRVIQAQRPLAALSTGACAANGGGDPIVLYDQLADRWLLSEFAFPMMLCVYISQTPDPTGAYFEYQFDTPNFPDYPKYGVHPDGYVVTSNEEPLSPDPIYVLDRTNMLTGGTPRPMQRLDISSVGESNLSAFFFQALTPADVDGQAPPPGSPAYIMRHLDDEVHTNRPAVAGSDILQVFSLTIDFNNPANTVLSAPTDIQVAEFDSELCGFVNFFCIPQPGTQITLDPLREVIMNRLQYRNFGTHETLVGTFVTDVDGTDHAGVRWFELRKQGGSPWTLFQEGTVSPDADNRWMSAIAMNGAGDIALMYNVSSTTTSPSIRYIGRLASDPLGTMPQGEYALAGGTGSGFQDDIRWGDYSGMAVDPVDDATFWFTGMYSQGDLTNNTRIGVVSFDSTGGGSTGIVEGVKYLDEDGDGEQDSTEPGVPGFYIYVDLDRDGRLSHAEPAAITGEFGQYVLPRLPDGAYTIREVPAAGYILTEPSAGFHEITIADNQIRDRAGNELLTLDFGNMPAFDHGDAPQPYPTLIEDDGPFHGVLANFHLGPSVTAGGVGVDAEDDGFQDPGFPQLTDDSTNIDDEDGVVFTTPIAAGSNSMVQVTVTNGNNTAGFLHGWIDFNRDGDWDDAGEQIIHDLLVGPGVHSIPFNVPVTAEAGPTSSRFRYAYERGLSYTGSAAAGEVEDHTTAVLIDTPQAEDDEFRVFLDTTDNELDVLENDLTSIQGFGVPLSAVFVTDPAHGTAVIDTRGTSSDPSDDVILYTPNRSFVGTDTFSYTVLDNVANSTDTATVTVRVELPDTAIAVDNYFEVPADSANNILDVLANDLVGPDGSLTISGFTTPLHGSLTLAGGNQLLSYTPAAGFEGRDQFEYTIQDNLGNLDSATVTVQIGDASGDDEMAIIFKLVKPDGSSLDNGIVVQGDEFILQAFVQDIRQLTGVPAPPANLQGVFSSYFDVLYDSQMLSVGEIEFGEEYGAGRNFLPIVPGIVDEVGAFQGQDATPLGPGQELLFELSLRAEFPGQSLLQADPADELPLHETLLNTSTDPDNRALTFEQISFGSLLITVLPAPDIVSFRLAPTALDGAPIATIHPGEQFLVQGYVRDLREPPNLSRGVFSAYMDVLFDPRLITINDIQFSDDFPAGRNAAVSAGLIDEIGAFQGPSGGALGSGSVLLYEILVTAETPGFAVFRTGPADDLPLHDTILRDQAPEAVPTSRIGYGNAFLSIVATPPPQFTNPANRLDVNADGEATPRDALAVINDLNRNGARMLAVAEGEPVGSQSYVDVNGDGEVSPLDVLAIINYLNTVNVGVIAEGEAAALILDSTAPPRFGGGPGASNDHPLSEREKVWMPVPVKREEIQAGAELSSNTRTSNVNRESSDALDSLLTPDLLLQVVQGWRDSRVG